MRFTIESYGMTTVWQLTSLESATFLRLSGHLEQHIADKVYGIQDAFLLYWAADYGELTNYINYLTNNANGGVIWESLYVWGLEGCGTCIDVN